MTGIPPRAAGRQWFAVGASGADGRWAGRDAAATAVATGASHRLREAGAEAAGCLREVPDGEHTVLMLLSDGLSGDQQEVVRGAYSVAGVSVPLVGGCAGDDLRMRRLVTSSRDNRVHTLDDRPAFDVYLERVGAPASLGRDAAAFTRFALTHPLGLRRRSGEEVRFVGGADPVDRSLSCIAEVPQGGLVWLMEGDRDSVMEGTAAACADALAPLRGHPPLGLIAFDCIARRGVLGDGGVGEEVEIMTAAVGGAPVAGFYTYGEIARTRGISGFHNQTLVALAVG